MGLRFVGFGGYRRDDGGVGGGLIEGKKEGRRRKGNGEGGKMGE